MTKRFKAKKHKKIKLRYLFLIVLIYLIIQLLNYLSTNVKLATSNEEFIKYMMNDSNHYMLYKINSKNIIHKMTKALSNIDINDPISILKKSFNYDENTSLEEKKQEKTTFLVYNENFETVDDVEEKKESNYIENSSETNVSNPRVYIYNSHQAEEYSSKDLKDYNITPNVLMASFFLQDKLNKLNIPTIVEEANIIDFMNLNNMKHKDSYKASRYFLEATLKEHNNLDLIIDLHRDSLNHASTTTTINDKNYAKVLFVVGLEHNNYQKNLDLASRLNDMIKSKYPSLTKGVLTKQGAGVNGIYNQDLGNNIVLIECGGYENTIDEVMNTTEILSEIIKEYLGEKNES